MSDKITIVADGYSMALGDPAGLPPAGLAVPVTAPEPPEPTAPAADDPPAAGSVEAAGGGWYLVRTPDGEEKKIQGREAAHGAAGIPLPDDEE